MGWPDSQIESLCDRAAEIVGEADIFAAVSMVVRADYETLYVAGSKPRKFPSSSPLGLCVWAILDRVVPILERIADNPQLNLVAEEGKVWGVTRYIVDWLKAFGDPVHVRILGTVEPGLRKEIPGLQVADMAATAKYHDEQSPPTLIPYARSDFSALSDLRGKVLREFLTPSRLQDGKKRIVKLMETKAAHIPLKSTSV